MNVHPFDGGTMHRFALDAGLVCVIVRPSGVGAEVEVYDEDALRPASGMTDEEFASAPLTVAARNKYGVGPIRSLLREVKAMHPGVCWWGWTRKTGIRVGRVGARV